MGEGLKKRGTRPTGAMRSHDARSIQVLEVVKDGIRDLPIAVPALVSVDSVRNDTSQCCR